jgi:hypothetical protein
LKYKEIYIGFIIIKHRTKMPKDSKTNKTTKTSKPSNKQDANGKKGTKSANSGKVAKGDGKKASSQRLNQAVAFVYGGSLKASVVYTFAVDSLEVATYVRDNLCQYYGTELGGRYFKCEDANETLQSVLAQAQKKGNRLDNNYNMLKLSVNNAAKLFKDVTGAGAAHTLKLSDDGTDKAKKSSNKKKTKKGDDNEDEDAEDVEDEENDQDNDDPEDLDDDKEEQEQEQDDEDGVVEDGDDNDDDDDDNAPKKKTEKNKKSGKSENSKKGK